jgi:TonB family protein
VEVDTSGNVTNASLDSAGPSKYFARLAAEAARAWKFTPPRVDGNDVPSEWLLRFAFGASDTTVSPTQVKP